jgi:hypothetical protein
MRAFIVPKGLFDCLATLAHRSWVCVKALLHSLEQMLMLPPRNSPLWPGCALRLERTILTGCGPIAPQHLAVFFVCIAIRQSLPWTAIGVFFRQIRKVLFTEALLRLGDLPRSTTRVDEIGQGPSTVEMRATSADCRIEALHALDANST